MPEICDHCYKCHKHYLLFSGAGKDNSMVKNVLVENQDSIPKTYTIVAENHLKL